MRMGAARAESASLWKKSRVSAHLVLDDHSPSVAVDEIGRPCPASGW